MAWICTGLKPQRNRDSVLRSILIAAALLALPLSIDPSLDRAASPTGRRDLPVTANARAASSESAPGDAIPPIPLDLDAGLGTAPGAVLTMRFEVTFLKIDVADIDLRIPEATARRLTPLLTERLSEEQIGDLARVAGAAPSWLARMIYRRDAGFGRLLQGYRSGLETAEKSGLISTATRESLAVIFEAEMEPLRDRGIEKGDQFLQRVDGDTVRTVLTDAEGRPLVDHTVIDPRSARAARGTYLGETSRFRNPLIRSLWESPR